MNHTEGEWEAYKSPLGDWVVHSGGTLICREVRHFNKDLIVAAPKLYKTLKLIFEAQEIDGDKVVVRTVPSSADVIRMKQALALAEA